MPVTLDKLRSWIVRDRTLDPFSSDFDRGKLESRLSAYKKFDKKAEAMLNFMLVANKLYVSVVNDIIKELSQLGTTTDNLFSLLFRHLNEEDVRSKSAFLEKLKTTNATPDPETLHYLVYHGKEDERMGIATSQQVLVDATAEVLRHIPIPGIEIKATGTDESIRQSVLRLWVMGNVICNLRDTCFSQVLHERAYVEWTTESAVRIVSEFPALEKIRIASEIRNTNRQMEIGTYMTALFEKDKQVKKKLAIGSVENGEIKIVITANDKIEQRLHYQASLMKYHPQLANVALDHFDGLTVSGVLDILAALFELFDDFKLVSTAGTHDPSSIPVFIDYDTLATSLLECCDCKIEIISKLLDSLCCSHESPYFWREPFYRLGNKLFFAIHPVSSPNVHLFIDKLILLEEISYERLLKLFKEFSVYELRHPIPMGFEFSVFIPELHTEGTDIFQPNICFITRDILLLAEFYTFAYPIEFDEHAGVLDTLSHFSQLVKEKSTLLETYFPDKVKGKKILTVIVTDYPVYSGLVMNNVPVLDFGLLHHYFFKGSMSKMTKTLEPGARQSAEFAQLRYYTDENEFNEGIQGFIFSPPPVSQLVNNMKIAPFVISQPFLPLQISIDKVNFIGELNVLQEKISDLENLMVYEYFGEPKGSDEKALNEKIQFELSTVLHKLALARYTPVDERWGIINAATKSKLVGHVHLLYYLTHITAELPGHLVKETNKFKTVPITAAANKLYDKLEAHLGKELSFLDFKIPDIFSESEEKLLISSALAIVDHSAYKKIDDKDINFLLLNLLVLSGFRNKYRIDEIFHTCCMNVIDMLNFSHHYQKARDLSEEMLILSIEKKEQWFGWYILFICYTAQNNLQEAALYGSLFFTAIKYVHPVKYRILISGVFALMKFFRNFGYQEFAISAHKAIILLDLDVVDKLKLGQVYFSVLAKELNTKPGMMNEIFGYIDQYYDQIIEYGTRSTTPWLGLLYNLKRYEQLKIYIPEKSIDEYIVKLEAHTDKRIVRETKAKIFGEGKLSKKEFIRMLLVVFETRDTSDIVNELSNLTLPAHNLIRESIINNDMEGILLAAIVLSDQSYVFQERPVTEIRAPLIKERNKELEAKLKHYLSHFLSQLNFRPGQVLLWIFSYEEGHGCLIIDTEKRISVQLIPQWIEKELAEWTSNISKFYFNASGIKSVDYDIAQQERDYDRWRNFFSGASIPANPGMNELLVCKSLEMTDLPHNLLVMAKDFVASSVPVCNVLSPEYFLMHNETHIIPAAFSIQAWIPIDEDNLTIQSGYSRLEPILQTFNAQIITSHYPESPLNGDINVFLAHGVRELGGFKAVRTSNDPLSSILQPSKVFGNGSIAVLFICNAGSVVEDTYAMQVTSMATRLLKSDYKAVVASYWPYDVTMSNRWLKVFLESMSNGGYVSEAVFHANKKLAEYEEESSTAYFAPAGQFAMHLYGNPNIKIDQNA